MKTKVRSFVSGLALGLFVISPSFAGVQQNLKVPFSQTVFVPCAAGGTGELLTISGQLHILFTETSDAAGGFHGQAHFQPMGASGVGSTTGDTYRGVGITRFLTNINAGGLPFIDTFVAQFNMIGTAGAVSLRIHETVHVIINENGEMTADVSNINVNCT